MDLFERMSELSAEGFYCSQIINLLAFEMRGEEHPDVIRALSGLPGGLGFSGKLCGSLTGGACLIGFYAGKGAAEETAEPNLNEMIGQLVDWFETEIGQCYGGTDCACILEYEKENMQSPCPKIVQAVFEKTLEILEENNL